MVFHQSLLGNLTNSNGLNIYKLILVFINTNASINNVKANKAPMIVQRQSVHLRSYSNGY